MNAEDNIPSMVWFIMHSAVPPCAAFIYHHQAQHIITLVSLVLMHTSELPVSVNSTPFARAFAQQFSGRTRSLASDLALLKLIFPMVFYTGGAPMSRSCFS